MSPIQLYPAFRTMARALAKPALPGLAALALLTTALTTTIMPQAASAQGLLSALFGPSGSRTVAISKRYAPRQIIVSFGDRRLYYVTRRGRAISYPIAIPNRKASWSGVMRVSQKRVNPTWTPTPEMRRQNPKLPAYVPGGHPRNPLGSRALYLGNSLYRIHGTDAPWLIGQAVSHGCIRMYDSDVQDLYRRTRIGTKVTVTWRRIRTEYASYW